MTHRGAARLILAILLSLTGVNAPSAGAVTGSIGGDTVSSEVDSEIARYFLESYAQGKRSDPGLDGQIKGVLDGLEGERITNEKLLSIADRASVDFSAMVFAHALTERHRAAKEAYLRNYQGIKEGRLAFGSAAQRYKFILVPGLFYRSKPETKGDLREVKATLEAAGFEAVGVPILEAGTVEQNARIIAEFVAAEPAQGKKFVIVSASKGGPDTLYALGHAMSPEVAAKVAIWFSIGGALRGSPVAEPWARWPRRWLASIIGLFNGFSVAMVESLGSRASLKRLEAVKMPSQLCVVHFVGVPLSGTVTDEVKGPYQSLRRLGPNDGITLLPDEILDGSTVITALGLDHWFRDPDLKRKILALAQTLLGQGDFLANCCRCAAPSVAAAL